MVHMPPAIAIFIIMEPEWYIAILRLIPISAIGFIYVRYSTLVSGNCQAFSSHTLIHSSLSGAQIHDYLGEDLGAYHKFL